MINDLMKQAEEEVEGAAKQIYDENKWMRKREQAYKALAVRLMAYKLAVKEAEKEMGARIESVKQHREMRTRPISYYEGLQDGFEIAGEVLHRHTQQQEEQ